MKKKEKVPSTRNFVHKYDIEVNRAQTHVDRKKNDRKGYRKHKGAHECPFDFSTISILRT